VMGMAIEGVDIAVLYPTTGLSLLARDNMDPLLSLALCQAYNNWIHEFSAYSPERLKFVAMLPVHDVHLACRELLRCVRELGAIGSFIRPNLVNGHYWHSNYWDPLYTLHEELGVTWGFHEGVSALYSHMLELYGENRFYRHVAAHWIEMQQSLIAMVIGGVFEFHPKLRVGFLEGGATWVPFFMDRLDRSYPHHLQVDIHAMRPDQLPRVAELVQRTNQFNTTAVRRTGSEIESGIASNEFEVWVVSVRDRFGVELEPEVQFLGEVDTGPLWRER